MINNRVTVNNGRGVCLWSIRLRLHHGEHWDRGMEARTLHKKGVWGQNASIGVWGRLRLHLVVIRPPRIIQIGRRR